MPSRIGKNALRRNAALKAGRTTKLQNNCTRHNVAQGLVAAIPASFAVDSRPTIAE